MNCQVAYRNNWRSVCITCKVHHWTWWISIMLLQVIREFTEFRYMYNSNRKTPIRMKQLPSEWFSWAYYRDRFCNNQRANTRCQNTTFIVHYLLLLPSRCCFKKMRFIQRLMKQNIYSHEKRWIACLGRFDQARYESPRQVAAAQLSPVITAKRTRSPSTTIHQPIPHPTPVRSSQIVLI